MRRRMVLLFWLLSHLLGQQMAQAHLISHVGEPTTTAARASFSGNDEQHGNAEALAHQCLSCAAFAGLDLAHVSAVGRHPTADCGASAVTSAVPPAPTFSRPAAFNSRAPPLPWN